MAIANDLNWAAFGNDCIFFVIPAQAGIHSLRQKKVSFPVFIKYGDNSPLVETGLKLVSTTTKNSYSPLLQRQVSLCENRDGNDMVAIVCLLIYDVHYN